MPSYVVYVDGPGEYTVEVGLGNEVIYVTQLSDLITIYDTNFAPVSECWFDLEPVQREDIINAARKYMEGYNDGMYSWRDALTDAINSLSWAVDLGATADAESGEGGEGLA